jgi:hypothetical protein
MHGAEEELVLILVADTARMRDAEQIELVVAWPTCRAGGRATGKGRREFHEIVTGWLVMRHRHLRKKAATLRRMDCQAARRQNALNLRPREGYNDGS